MPVRPSADRTEDARDGGHLALVGGTFYASPADTPIRDGAILIRDGVIVAAGPRDAVPSTSDAQVVDCSGLTITPGFWNSHVHFFERKWADAAALPADELKRQLEEMLTSHGFTSVFDLGSPWENTRALRDRIERGEVPGPAIRSTGAGLLPHGALPSDQVLALMGVMKFPAPEITDAMQATAAVRKLVEAGVDAIKVFASSPRGAGLPESILAAAADEAHRMGKMLFVHPNSAADVLGALRAGADVIAHTTPMSGAWDEAILTAMKRRHAALTPTLQIMKYFRRHDRVSTQEQVVEIATGQLRAWLGAGGAVLFGTDLGAVEYDPTDEYVLMSAAGMTFAQILASLTTMPAERFGDSHRLGRIAPGYQADLVALRGDPGEDIAALANVELTIRAGRILYRAH
jgi:imidazolonepropionase-like amidohydrolase